MRGFAGFNFKPNTIAEDQEAALIYSLNNCFDHPGPSSLQLNADTYLFGPSKAPIVVYGVNDGLGSPIGIVWGSSNIYIIQALKKAMLFRQAFPYVTASNTIYCVINGEIGISLYKGDRVITPQGAGTVYSIDDISDICVELDNDGAVFYEYSLFELGKGQ